MYNEILALLEEYTKYCNCKKVKMDRRRYEGLKLETGIKDLKYIFIYGEKYGIEVTE